MLLSSCITSFIIGIFFAILGLCYFADIAHTGSGFFVFLIFLGFSHEKVGTIDSPIEKKRAPTHLVNIYKKFTHFICYVPKSSKNG